jgi:hypothetical protein
MFLLFYTLAVWFYRGCCWDTCHILFCEVLNESAVEGEVCTRVRFVSILDKVAGVECGVLVWGLVFKHRVSRVSFGSCEEKVGKEVAKV